MLCDYTSIAGYTQKIILYVNNCRGNQHFLCFSFLYYCCCDPIAVGLTPPKQQQHNSSEIKHAGTKDWGLLNLLAAFPSLGHVGIEILLKIFVLTKYLSI